MFRSILAGWLALAAAAPQETTIKTTVPLVVAPATVTDRAGKYVDGLRAQDFVLYDNRVVQKIDVETVYTPIALVAAVQSSEISAAALAKIRKIGSMIEPLVVGSGGEAAVVTYADEVRTVQEFTGDPWKLVRTFRALECRGAGSRMIDAVTAGVRLLAARPADRRRVLLVVGESRDRSSETSLQDAVTLAQRENVTVYTLTWSAMLTPFTAKPGTAPPAGDGGMNLLAIFTEIARLGAQNAAEVLAGYTGGRHLSFLKQKALETAVARIGEELHSQYLLSFSPALSADEEYHRIQVRVVNRPELVVRSRPGYWMATSR